MHFNEQMQRLICNSCVVQRVCILCCVLSRWWLRKSMYKVRHFQQHGATFTKHASWCHKLQWITAGLLLNWVKALKAKSMPSYCFNFMKQIIIN